MNSYVGQVCWPRLLVIKLVYKGRVSLLVIHHLVRDHFWGSLWEFLRTCSWFVHLSLVDIYVGLCSCILALCLHPLRFARGMPRLGMTWCVWILWGSERLLGFLPRDDFPWYILCSCAWLSTWRSWLCLLVMLSMVRFMHIWKKEVKIIVNAL